MVDLLRCYLDHLAVNCDPVKLLYSLNGYAVPVRFRDREQTRNSPGQQKPKRMNTTRSEYIQQKHSELYNQLGCFFAFNTDQFKEGIEKAGGVEKTGKYLYVSAGLYCPSKNIKALLKGFDEIKKQWHTDRKAAEKIKLTFVGIDNWNRPVWKAPEEKEFFGSVNELFSYGATEKEVTEKVDIYGLCYFGSYFGCEPMGTDVPDKYFI